MSIYDQNSSLFLKLGLTEIMYLRLRSSGNSSMSNTQKSPIAVQGFKNSRGVFFEHWNDAKKSDLLIELGALLSSCRQDKDSYFDKNLMIEKRQEFIKLFLQF